MVVDGILVLAVPELRRRLDLAVFVDASTESRLARRMERDVRERGRTTSSVRDQFAATVAPMHETFVEPIAVHADLRLDGTGDLASNLETLVDAVIRLRPDQRADLGPEVGTPRP